MWWAVLKGTELLAERWTEREWPSIPNALWSLLDNYCASVDHFLETDLDGSLSTFFFFFLILFPLAHLEMQCLNTADLVIEPETLLDPLASVSVVVFKDLWNFISYSCKKNICWHSTYGMSVGRFR